MKLLGVILAAALLAGCGGDTKDHIDHTRLERAIHTWAVHKGGADTSVKVQCPSDVAIQAGATFHCIVSEHRQSVRVTVTIENDKGEVTWVAG